MSYVSYDVYTVWFANIEGEVIDIRQQGRIVLWNNLLFAKFALCRGFCVPRNVLNIA